MCSRYTMALIFLWSLQAGAELCASKPSELDQSDRLKTVKTLFVTGVRVGMVNESKGSFVVLESSENQITMVYYTSGLFQLYGMKRDGPLKFCDTGSSLRMIGLGQDVEVKIGDGKLIADDGGPKRTFSPGPVPDLLQRLHHLDERGIASEPE